MTEADRTAIGELVDGKLAAFQATLQASLREALFGPLLESLKAMPEAMKQDIGALGDSVAALMDEATEKRFKVQRELISRSDEITAEVLELEVDPEDLLLRFDVSLLKKDGTPIKRVRGHNTLTRALASNSMAESPDQLEGVLSTKIIRPLVGALQQTVTEALLPPEEDDLPPMLPLLNEPTEPSAEQGDRLQSDPGAASEGSDLH